MSARLYKLIFLIISSLPIVCTAQVTTTPASSSCNCDGSFTYAPFPGSPTFFQLYDHQGLLIESVSDVNGTYTANNLCGDVYLVESQSPEGNTTQLIQVIATGAAIGTANTVEICSTSNPINLSTFLGAFTLGGQWYRPNGTTFNGSYNPNVESGGLYYYMYNFGGCPVFTGVLVSEIQNGNAGLQTTYLICDTYNEFFMTDFLEGNPDYTGHWTDATGNPIDGYYDPATMSSALFVYIIDNVPGCNPVYNTLFVDEQDTPNPGISTTIAICDNAPVFNMFDQIPGNPDSGGFWFSPLNVPTDVMYDPNADILGTYRYVVPATSPCQQQEVQITISYTTDDPSGETASIDICTSDEPFDMTESLSGNPTFGGLWSDAQGNYISNIFDPSQQNSGTYFYYVPNVGCSPTGAQLNITEHTQPSAGLDVLEEICQSQDLLDLNSLLVNADMGGEFQTSSFQIVNPQWSISNTQLSQFYYIVSAPYCPNDSAELVIGVVAEPFNPSDLSLEYCSTDQTIDLSQFYSEVASPIWTSNNQNVSPQYSPSDGSAIITLTSLSNNVCPNYSAAIEIAITYPLFDDAILEFNVCNNESPFNLEDYIDDSIEMLGSWWDIDLQPTSPIVPQDVAGTYVYSFIGNDNGPCPINTQEIHLIVSDSIHAGGDFQFLFCTNSEAFSLYDLLPSDINNLGTWTINSAPAETNFDPSATDAGVYSYQLEGNIGCPGDNALYTINLQQPTIAQAGENIVLCSENTPLVIGSAAVPGANYSWYPAFNISNSTVSNPTVTLENPTTEPIEFEYFVTLENGVCISQDSVSIFVNPLPVLNLNSQIDVCDGDQITLVASNDYSLNWSPANLFSNPSNSTQTFIPTTSEYVYLDASNGYGCTNRDSILIDLHPLPVLYYDWITEESCSPYILQVAPFLENENVNSSSWYINGVSSGNAPELDYILTEPGTYDIMYLAESEFGCVSTWAYDEAVVVHPFPFSSFTWSPHQPSIIQPEVQFENLSAGAVSYEWTFGDGVSSNAESPLHRYNTDSSTEYDVCLIVSSDFGCTDTTCNVISIENMHVLYAPNAFTPDQDGLNDVFRVYLNGFENSTFELIIFDRWGTEIFKSDDPDIPWVGDVRNGQNFAADGIYNWQVKIKVDLIADYQVYTGFVTLIR
ncbi:MAG: gliding motility-associated C-terminal domain-containing protein [Flavobacteriales bacterium]